jgi:hypothetical protein
MKPSPEKLQRHLRPLKSVLGKGRWLTLVEIDSLLQEKGVCIETQSISARLRDLRKVEHGGHNVERRYLANGIYQYRLGKGAR